MPIDAANIAINPPSGQITATAMLAASSSFDARLANPKATPARASNGTDIGKAPVRYVRCTKAGTITFATQDTPNIILTRKMIAGDEIKNFIFAYVATNSAATVEIGG